MGDPGNCRSCGADIVWLKLRGKPHPAEAQRRTVISDDGELVAGHESHFAYCPNARSHRRKR